MHNEAQPDDALTVAVGAALLNSIGRLLNAWSMLAALAALLLIGLQKNEIYSTACFSASLAAALLQAYFAARCAFDAAIFTAFGGDAGRYAVFDSLLTCWKLRKAQTVDHTLEQRVQGALRLLRSQAFCFAIQVVLLIAGSTGV